MSDSRVGGQGAEDRARYEHHDAEQHHLLAAEAVAQGAEGEHEAGEEESVAVDHPLYLRDGGMEGGLQVLESDAHDRRIEERQEQDAAEGYQRPARTQLGQHPFGDGHETGIPVIRISRPATLSLRRGSGTRL